MFIKAVLSDMTSENTGMQIIKADYEVIMSICI